jgi:hypothetical protein
MQAVIASAKEAAIGLAILAVALWLVFGSSPLDWAHFKIGPNGLEVDAVVKEVKANTEVIAKDLEKARNDLHALQDRALRTEKALDAYRDNKTESNLAELVKAIKGTEKLATTAVAQSDESAVETAKTLFRLDEIASTIAQRQGTQSALNPLPVTGWYYLGKISSDRKTWLPSSALGQLVFTPPLDPNANILQQIQVGRTEVRSTGYKYLRSKDSKPGKRVDSDISRTLGPNVPVRILEVDASGVDPADGETVLWARVQVVPIQR